MRYRVGLLAASVLLVACTIKPIYNNLYWLVPWYVEDYVTLDSAQDQQVRDRLREIVREHRKQEIPEYSAFVSSIKPALSGITEAEVDQYYVRLQQLLGSLKVLLVPEVIEILQSLTVEQQQELFANLAERNAERREHLEDSEDKWLQRYRDGSESLLEYCLGQLTEEQEELVAQYLTRLKPDSLGWINSREIWQSKLRELVEGGGDSKALTHLMMHNRDYWPGSYKNLAEYNRRQAFQLISELSYTLTKGQRQHFSDKLDGLVSDLNNL